MKTCTRCRETRPLADFDGDRTRSDGKDPRCKVCKAANRKKWKERIEQAEATNPSEGKTCNKCQVWKPTSAFNRGEGRLGRDSYCRPCKWEGSQDTRAAYYEKNRDRLNEISREYQQTAAEKIAARKREYRARNKEAIAAYAAQYRASPEGKASQAASRARRRAKKLQLDCGCATTKTLASLWALSAGRCTYCGADAEHYDHVQPLDLQGWHCIANLTPACASCNHRKWAHPLDVFLARYGGQRPTEFLVCPNGRPSGA